MVFFFFLFGSFVIVLNSLPLTLSGSHYVFQADLGLKNITASLSDAGVTGVNYLPSVESTVCGP